MCCKITAFALVVLLIPKTSSLLTARVVNGTLWGGRLEILYNKTWNTVCDDDFTDIDAQVACRMLGFNGTGAVAVSSSMYGPGQGNILLDDVRCTGTETSLEQCSHAGYYHHNCAHQEDIGIICNIPGQLTARLVNGTRWAGRLEILYNGEWSTVCDDSFETSDAQVACRMSGFASASASYVTSSTYGAGQGRILLDDINCRGTETSLEQCFHRGFYVHDCSHGEDIGIICNRPGQLSVRLVNGTQWAGRLEVLYNGEWSTVCDDYFESVDAQVVCRMLGYTSPGAIAVTSSIYGAGQGRILLDDVNCRGTETSLEQCSHPGFYVHNCAHSEDIGIVCNISGQLEARLVGGSQTTGRLEILYNGTWNTVCDDGFRDVDAQVACRMLGFGSLGAVAVASNIFGPGQGRILLDDVNCLGTETSLDQCSHGGFFHHNCQHNEDIGITCETQIVLPEARLVSGTAWEGRLEILYNGKWSTVCDDQFGTEEAHVACRMLGYHSSEAVYVSSSVYGAGQGSILLDDLSCQGTEANLIQCSHAGLYRHNCQHSKDIGVICSNGASKVRLTGKWRTSLHMGRPDILINGEWSMMCDITVTTARVICRHLGYPSIVAKVVDSSTFGPLQGRFLNAALNCVGNETNIFSCLTSVYGYSSSCSTQQTGVICSNTNQNLYIVMAANSAANSYPVLEGTNAILKCERTQRDQNITQFTWPETAGGRPLGEYLTFDNVTRDHNGGRVQCQGNYLSSGTTQSTVSEILLLQVYYHPFISVTFSDNGCEPVDGFSNHCAVTEGDNCTLRCEADSNPPPASITWSGKVNSSTQHMSIVSANRLRHGGEYVCTVVTQSSADDTRLPLTSSHRLTVVIKYPSTVLRFQFNAEDNKTVVVSENSSVDMLCEADGRPTPQMSLVRINDNNLELNSTSSGDIQVTEGTEELSYTINRVQCEHAGDYTCEVDNGIGHDSQTVRLLVLCAPRRNVSQEQVPLLDVGVSDALLTLEMIAYPTPDIAGVMYHGEVLNDGNKSVTVENMLNVTCHASISAPSLVTCSITVVNLTHATEGFYTIVFKNNIGELNFVFKIGREVTGTKDQTSSLPVGAIAGGSSAAVVVVLIIIVIIAVTRRYKLREPDSIYDCPDTRPRCESLYDRPSVKRGMSNEVFTMSDVATTETGEHPLEREYVNTRELDVGMTSIYENVDFVKK